MNQRTKKPGLWSAPWCASCASCGWRWSESAVVLMGLQVRSAYWFVRLATLGFAGAGVEVVVVPAVGGAGVMVSVELPPPPAEAAAAAGLVPGMWPPFDATQAANCAGEVTSTAIGMNPWRAPHSSEHWPK